jgi:predicted site-specific integrase-resolvase
MGYARVSSARQKPDLAHQVAALHASCAAHGYQLAAWREESGSGLNSPRTRFHHLLDQIELGQVRRLIIAHDASSSPIKTGSSGLASSGLRRSVSDTARSCSV